MFGGNDEKRVGRESGRSRRLKGARTDTLWYPGPNVLHGREGEGTTRRGQDGPDSTN